MAGYTPLFSSIAQGSLFGSPDMKVWLMMLALQERGGIVDATPAFIAAALAIPVEEVQAAIARFCAPDPYSRTKDHDGRRLAPIEGQGFGWVVLNHRKYQEKARLMAREAQRTAERRAERPRNPPQSPAIPPSDSDSDSDKKKIDTSVTSEASVELKLDSGAVGRIFDHWKQAWNHPKAKLDPKRRRIISVALKGYSEADLCTAITGYQNSSHHRGDNERQTVYDDIGLLLRDAAHIDAGLAFAANNGHARPAKRLDLILRTETEFHAYEAALQQGLSFSNQAEWDTYHARQAH